MPTGSHCKLKTRDASICSAVKRCSLDCSSCPADMPSEELAGYDGVVAIGGDG